MKYAEYEKTTYWDYIKLSSIILATWRLLYPYPITSYSVLW